MAWGLDIESDRVRLCHADLRRGHLRLRRRAETEVPPGLIRPSLKDANLTDAAALRGLVRVLCKEAGCRGWVRVALPDPVFTLRTLVTEALPENRQEAQRFLRWQARDLLPFPMEEARLDFLPSAPGADGRLRVVCLMGYDRVLAEYEKVLGETGLRIAVVDARSVSLAQAASTLLRHDTVGLLHIADTRSTFVLVEEGRPRFWRILPQGRSAWTDSGRSGLVREIADTISFCQESEGIGAVSALMLGGLGFYMDEVASAFTDWLGMPAIPLDLCRALRAPGYPEDLLEWGPAIGAAIRSC